MNLNSIHSKLGLVQRVFAENPALVYLVIAGSIALVVVGGILVDALMIKISARLQLSREKKRAKSRSAGEWPLAR